MAGLSGKVAPPLGEVAGIEIRVDPPFGHSYGDGHATMTVKVSQDSNEHKVQSNEDALCAQHQRRARKPKDDKKQSE